MSSFEDKAIPEVRTIELFVEIVDPIVSSGGLNPNPHTTNVARPSCPAIQNDTEEHRVASPSFGFNLQGEAVDCDDDLGDSQSFGELAIEIAATLHQVSSPVV
ncbi:hypothetical protein PIB30_031312 [Stylosanthes scabra]|uniref:Uncharacterized protein n=1 Tax=Stylosanthes scabra TaxID=79078 RepID=A0ABU6RC36_9FABA|nr:hypothetical protein [Stylosanthes scabra]